MAPAMNSGRALLDLSISETVDEVIVYHADRLHVRIHDSRTNKTESPVFEVFAKCFRFR